MISIIAVHGIPCKTSWKKEKLGYFGEIKIFVLFLASFRLSKCTLFLCTKFSSKIVNAKKTITFNNAELEMCLAVLCATVTVLGTFVTQCNYTQYIVPWLIHIRWSDMQNAKKEETKCLATKNSQNFHHNVRLNTVVEAICKPFKILNKRLSFLNISY